MANLKTSGLAKTKPKKQHEKKFTKEAIIKDFKHNKYLYALILPLVVYIIVFSYLPMGGLSMAFCDYRPKFGIFGSLFKNFTGLQHFKDFFDSYYFGRLIRNTILLNVWNLIISFPLTIIIALLINEAKSKYFKSTVQMLSYMPHFISLVVVCGIVVDFCKSTGVLGTLMAMITGKSQNLLSVMDYWRPIYIGSGLWQSIGFGTIIYLAALSGVDQQLYEAASIDGAGYMKQMWHITLPGIRPTIIITLIMEIGHLMASSSEKTILMYSPQIYEKADIIASYVYRRGLLDADYSFSTAVTLFNSVINFVLIIIANQLSKKYSETSLF